MTNSKLSAALNDIKEFLIPRVSPDLFEKHEAIADTLERYERMLEWLCAEGIKNGSVSHENVQLIEQVLAFDPLSDSK